MGHHLSNINVIQRTGIFFTKSNISLTEELKNGALVIPAPGLLSKRVDVFHKISLGLAATRFTTKIFIFHTQFVIGHAQKSVNFHSDWPAHRAGLLRCNFFGQPGSVSKFPPFLWVKLWVGWVERGYIEISRYFPALWINRVTLVTQIKLWYSLGYYITFESPNAFMVCFFASRSLIHFFSVYHSSPSSYVRSSLIGWSFILGNTDCNTVPTWWM